MTQRLTNITTHPDLNVTDPIPSEADSFRQSSWAEYSSSKFQFLGFFIDAATDENAHIILYAKEDKTIQIIRNYLLGKGFTYPQSQAESTNNLELSRELLSFTIRSTDNTEIWQPRHTPSLMIALDNSFDASNPSVQALRTTDDEFPVPVIRPIVSNSIEHVDLCLPASPDINRFRRLVRHTHAYLDSVGELQDNAQGVQETAEEIVSYLNTNFQVLWNMPPLEALDVEDVEDATSDVEGGLAEPDEHLRSTAPSRQKRWRVS